MSSNFQIEKYMEKNFKGEFLGCFTADNLPHNPSPSSNLIANYSDGDDSDGGTHWVAMINLNSDNGEPSLFFDSYGGDPDFEDIVLDKKTNFKINRKIIFDDSRILSKVIFGKYFILI